MKRTLVVMLLTLCISCSIALPASAAEDTSVQDSAKHVQVTHVSVPFTSKNLVQLGQASIKDAVVINGVTNYLYPTFDDLDTTLVNLKAEIPEYYRLVEKQTGQLSLKELYNLPHTEFNSAPLYIDVEQAAEDKVLSEQKANSSVLQSPAQLTALKEAALEELLSEKAKFDTFLDIYENKAQNEEIKAYLENNPNPDPEVLAYMLPYTAPFVVSYFENVPPAPAAAQTFNVSNGTAYAVKWAQSPNTLSYPYFPDKDCTNFASQILVAGGIKMHEDSSTKRGWWCKRIGTVNPGSFSCSNSWSVADAFVRFMGTNGNTCKDFKRFSAKLRAGDFIAFDRENDGEWNHVGYVTTIGDYGTYSYKDGSTTKSKQYTTFCVAQHSANYYAWVHSAANGWETLDNGTNVYAVVRRNATINF